MSVETNVYSTLTGNSALMAVATGGVYPEPLPDNFALPCIAYSLISDVPVASTSSGSFNRYRVQISLCAASYATTRSLRDKLQDIIDSNNNWQKVNAGPDMYDDDGHYHYLPVDVMIIQGD